jgi:hypothetical protein
MIAKKSSTSGLMRNKEVSRKNKFGLKFNLKSVLPFGRNDKRVSEVNYAKMAVDKCDLLCMQMVLHCATNKILWIGNGWGNYQISSLNYLKTNT